MIVYGTPVQIKIHSGQMMMFAVFLNTDQKVHAGILRSRRQKTS